MTIADDYTAGHLRAWLRERIANTTRSVMTGTLDHPEYRAKSAYAQAMEHTLEQLAEIEKQINAR